MTADVLAALAAMHVELAERYDHGWPHVAAKHRLVAEILMTLANVDVPAGR